MKNFRLFLFVMSVVMMLFTGVQPSMAHDKDEPLADSPLSLDTAFTAHWMSLLPDSTRLCDLSIACSHDAATWDSNLTFYKDQEYCERELFQFGVRAFDLRIGPDGNYRHGDHALSDDCKTFEEEQLYHLPTLEQLKGEFMIIYVQFEGDNYPQKEVEQTYYDWAKAFAFNGTGKNDKNKYPTDILVDYKKGLTLGDVRGKILVIGNSNDKMYTSKLVENDCPKIPIALHGGWGFNGLYSTVNTFTATGLEPTEASDTRGQYFCEMKNPYDSRGRSDVTREEQITEVKKLLNAWVKEYSENYSDRTDKCGMILKLGINSYYRKGIYLNPADMIAPDQKEGFGVNHTVYNYLSENKEMKEKQIPYGIIQFDFVAVKEFMNATTYGDKLLERIILHNFECLSKAKYISEIAMFASWAQDDNTGYSKAFEAMTNAQYQLLANVGKGNNNILLIGYKTTDNIAEALSDIIVCRNKNLNQPVHSSEDYWWDEKSAPSETLNVNNTNYYLAPTHQISYSGNYCKNTQDAECDQFVYLYYTKLGANNSDPSQVITSLQLRDAVAEESGYLKQYDLTDKEVAKNADHGYFTTNDGKKYLCVETHEHDFQQEYDDAQHYLLCTTCGLKKNVHDHECELSQKNGIYQVTKCNDCLFEIVKECAAESYNAEGFGVCKDCGAKCVESAEVYLNTCYIANAGQLYWFATQVNHLNKQYSAVLMADIVMPEDINSTLPWVPIGTYNTYQATFDGAGHTISGINYGSSSTEGSHGLFGFVDGGTIKNLGIINSSFTISSAAPVGSLAGTLKDALVENVYSTADIHIKSKETQCGGFVGYSESSTLSNGFFNGTIDDYRGNPVNNLVGGSQNTIVNGFYLNSGSTQSEFSNGTLLSNLNEGVKQYNSTQDGISWVYWKQKVSEDAIPSFDISSMDLDYLCFTTKENQTTLAFKQEGKLETSPVLQFSIDCNYWFDYSMDYGIDVPAGGTKVYFRAKGRNATFSKDGSHYIYFDSNKPVVASGNSMTLLNRGKNETTVPDYAFISLFSECNSLTTAPELPATTLGQHCYSNMFVNCTNLSEAPALPATKLADYCYSNMFQGCEKLIVAPVLPAKSLVTDCYRGMFSDCQNLNYIVVNFEKWDRPNRDTYNWVGSVAETGTFFCPSSISNTTTSDNTIPTGWTVHTLPVTIKSITTLIQNTKPLEIHVDKNQLKVLQNAILQIK